MTSIQNITQLLETIRVEQNSNTAYIYDFDEHIARLFNSINELGFSLPSEANHQDGLTLLMRNQAKNKAQYFFTKPVSFIGSRFSTQDVIARSEATQQSRLLNIEHLTMNFQLFKLRILYSKNGQFEMNIEPYTRDLSKEWQVKILDPKEFHIETSDAKWRHKFYPREQIASSPSAPCNDGWDELIWTNEQGHLCEGSFTNIFFYNALGELCTPSLDCNILPGTMRAKIVENFQVEEGNYRPEDLANGFYLVNSMFIKPATL